MDRGADAQCRLRRREPLYRERSPAASIANLGLELLDRLGHRNRLRREQLLPGAPLLLEVDRQRLVDRVADHGRDGGLALARRRGDAAVAAVVEENLKTPLEHVHTLACADPAATSFSARSNDRLAVSAAVPERRLRRGQQRRR